MYFPFIDKEANLSRLTIRKNQTMNQRIHPPEQPHFLPPLSSKTRIRQRKWRHLIYSLLDNKETVGQALPWAMSEQFKQIVFYLKNQTKNAASK